MSDPEGKIFPWRYTENHMLPTKINPIHADSQFKQE